MMIMANGMNFSKFLGFGMLFFLMACDPSGTGSGNAGSSQGVPASLAHICDPDSYDLDCMRDDKTSTSDGLLDVLGGLKDELVKASGKDISDKRQDEYGESSRKEIEREFPVVSGHPKANLLEGLMRKLLKLRKNPSSIDFNVYVVRGQMVNAFTLGGEIYVTHALLDEVESTDELACVIGHEIGHNELGHVADRLKEVELAQGIFGEEAGAAVAGFVGLLTMGFNQHSEAEADLYGIDLALAAGYDACRGIDFWNRLKEQEGEANDLDNFFRSHPYSSRRAHCYRSHISTAHSLTCSN